MAHEPESSRGDATIARAGKRKWGYDTRQVDTFLARAHRLYESEVPKLTQQDIGNVSFDLRKNGYIIPQVDAALSRLSRAVSDRRTAWQISQYGRQQWLNSAVALQQKLAMHATRAEGERFAPGRDGDPAYDRKQVDRLVDQVVAKTASQLGLENADMYSEDSLADITADRVSNVIFTQRKGKHGYDERQVDYYLVRVIELLQQLESYMRLGIDDNLGSDRSNARRAKTSVSESYSNRQRTGRSHSPNETDIAPSFAATGTDPSAAETAFNIPPMQVNQTSNSNVGYAPSQPVNPDEAAQFDQLHQAEQAIFDGADAAQAPVLAPPIPKPAAVKPVNANRVRDARSLSGSRQSELGRPPVVNQAQPSVMPPEQSSTSLAALAASTQVDVPQPLPQQPPASPSTASAGRHRAQPAPTPAPLEETTHFNPLAEWNDDTGSGNNYSNVPEPSAAQTNASSGTSMFSVQFPQVDVDIPSLGFSSFSASDELDNTRQ